MSREMNRLKRGKTQEGQACCNSWYIFYKSLEAPGNQEAADHWKPWDEGKGVTVGLLTKWPRWGTTLTYIPVFTAPLPILQGILINRILTAQSKWLVHCITALAVSSGEPSSTTIISQEKSRFWRWCSCKWSTAASKVPLNDCGTQVASL